MMMKPFAFPVLATLLAASCGGAMAEEKIDFNRQIRPLLSNACIACHGPDAEERKADLRLDTFEGASALAASASEPPEVLRERVTSKGGTTHAAISAMETSGIKPAFVRAMHAACQRAAELGDAYGAD